MRTLLGAQWVRNGGWAASNQTGALPWLCSLAQNCREEKERPQRRKKPHKVTSKARGQHAEGAREESLPQLVRGQISQVLTGKVPVGDLSLP